MPIDNNTLAAIGGQQAVAGISDLGQAIERAAAFREEKRNNAKTRQLRDMQMAGMQLDQQKAGLDIEMALEQKDEYLRNKGKRQLQREEDMAALKDQSKQRRLSNVFTAESRQDSDSSLKAMVRKGDISQTTYDQVSKMPLKQRKDYMAKNEFWYDEDFQHDLWLKQAEASTKLTVNKPKFEGSAAGAENILAKVDSIPRTKGGNKDYADALSDEQARTLASGSRGLLEKYKDSIPVSQDVIDTMMVEEYKTYYEEADEAKPWYKTGQEPKINAWEIKERVDKRLYDQYLKSQGMTKGSDNVVDDNIPEGMKGFDLQAMSRDTGKSIPQLVQEWQDAQ